MADRQERTDGCPPVERGETWDCGCPFEGPHNDACAFAASPVERTAAVPDTEEPRT